MPVIQVNLMQGYDEEARQRIAEALTDAVRTVIAAPADGVTVILNEVPPASYMRGRSRKQPGPPLPNAVEQVKGFLAAMEARDLDQANTFLSEDFEMTFPGDATFRTLKDMIDWARPRYNWVKKKYDRFDTAPTEEGVAVTCQGTLYGEFPNGDPFEGVRFTDWFLVKGGLLTQQKVWNDLAEYRLSSAGL